MFKRVHDVLVALAASRANLLKVVVVVVLWAAGVSAIAFVMTSDDSTSPVATAHAVGGAQVRSNGGTATARFSTEDVQKVAAAALNDRGSAAFANLPRTKDGKSISMADVPLKEVAFVAGAWEIRSNSGSLVWQTNVAEDVWLVLYRLEGVTVEAHGWEGVGAVIEFGVIISDVDGAVEMVAVNTFNPEPPPPSE